MPNLGPLELIIVLAIVLLVFGVGRLSKIGGEMGSAIREFREGLQGPEKEETEEPAERADAASERDS